MHCLFIPFPFFFNSSVDLILYYLDCNYLLPVDHLSFDLSLGNSGRMTGLQTQFTPTSLSKNGIYEELLWFGWEVDPKISRVTQCRNAWEWSDWTVSCNPINVLIY